MLQRNKKMIDEIIVIALICLIIGGAVAYIVKAKRNGQKCIGCPYSKSCNGCSCNKANGENE